MGLKLNSVLGIDLDKLALVSLILFVVLFAAFNTFPLLTSPLKDLMFHFHLMSTLLSVVVSRLVWLKVETRLSLRHIIWRHFFSAFVHRKLLSLVRNQQRLVVPLVGRYCHLHAELTFCSLLHFGARLGCIGFIPFFTSGATNYLPNRRLPSLSSSSSSSSPKNIIFFIHGGGFCVNTATERLVACALFSRSLPVLFYAAAYKTSNGLSSTTMSDIRSCVRDQYDQVRREHPNAVVVLAGDSAGGNMALHLAMDIAEEAAANKGKRGGGSRGGRPVAGVLLLSPWLDVDGSANLISGRRGWKDMNDYMDYSFLRTFHESIVRRWRKAGNEGSDVEPFADLLRRVKYLKDELPPMLIVSGGGELMVDEARALYLATCQDYNSDSDSEKESAAGSPSSSSSSCDLYVAASCPHDFVMNAFLCAGGLPQYDKTWDDVTLKLAQFLAVDPDDLTLKAAGDEEEEETPNNRDDDEMEGEEEFDEFLDDDAPDGDKLVFRPVLEGDEFMSAREFCDGIFFGGEGGGRRASKKKVGPDTKGRRMPKKTTKGK